MNTYREILPDIWACTLFDNFRNKNGVVYGVGFLKKQKDYAEIWIGDEEKIPGRSNIRLRSKNECVYCKILITAQNGVGDHTVSEFERKNVLWTVPCCKSCNSSKNNKDLIEWWCGFKKRNIVNLGRDVMSIFVRAKYRLLKKENKLDDIVPEIYLIALEQIKKHWSEK